MIIPWGCDSVVLVTRALLAATNTHCWWNRDGKDLHPRYTTTQLLLLYVYHTSMPYLKLS